MENIYNEFQMSAMKFMNNIVLSNLNKAEANSNRIWTKENLINVFIFLSMQNYKVKYNEKYNKVEAYNDNGNLVFEFLTYIDFIDWYNDKTYSC